MEASNKINGVGKDAEVSVNIRGGKQSKMTRAFHLMPVFALFKAAETLQEGYDKYEKAEDGGPKYLPNSLNANWRLIEPHEHINHALQHLLAHLGGDASDDHLSHAFVRIGFAIDTQNDINVKAAHSVNINNRY